jgi:hypothetical protein
MTFKLNSNQSKKIEIHIDYIERVRILIDEFEPMSTMYKRKTR